MTIFYLDYVNGSDANDGSSWALAWKTITSGATAARIAPGDIIRIAKSPDPTSLGMTATWTDLSRAVVLNSALTANVDLCETAWTPSANVTATASATRKEGSSSSSLAIAALFVTGKVAYKALAGATDYSGYQQLSFWIRTNVAIAANTLKISLCSDAIGDTIVDDFIIPAVPGIARWTCFTVDKGAALGASIQSVALYALLDPGTVTVLLDDIIACKAVGSADSLSLTSLISKNSLAQGGTEGWYGIKSINGTAIQLDADANSGSGIGKGYSGTTETVTTYKRETIKTVLASLVTTVVQEIQDNGTLGNNIQYQGGWNTATTIQDGETYFGGSNGFGSGLQLSSKSYNTLNYLNFSRYYLGLYFINTSNNNTITTISNANNSQYGIFFSASNNNTITTISNVNNNASVGISFTSSSNNNTITTISNANNNVDYGISFSGSSNNNIMTTISNVNNNNYGIYFSASNNNTITTISNVNNNTSVGISFTSSNNNTITTISNVNNNTSNGITFSSSNNNTITTISNVNNNTSNGITFSSSNNNIMTTISNVNNNGLYGISFSGSANNIIRSLSTTGNASGAIYNNNGTNYVNKAIIAEAIKVAGFTDFANSRIFANNYNNDTNDHRIYTDGGTIVSQIVTRHTASGIAWQLSPTSATRQVTYPLDLCIAKIAVSANNLVTVKGWFRRTNTGLTMQLVCKGRQIAGVPSDVVTSMTAIADTWEELTITFTPTEVGVVEILALAYGGTTYSGYVDDMTITQA